MEKPRFEGQPGLKETMSPRETCQAELKKTAAEYNEFATAFDKLFAGEAGEELFKKINAGLFTSDQADTVGFKGEKARVVYGDWNMNGNAEGSLYTTFNENVLRIRSAGYHEIYLNHGNRIAIKTDEQSGGVYTLRPETIQGRKILGITEQGVETENPLNAKYSNALWEYEYKVREQEKRKSSILARLQDKVMNRGRSAETLVKPVKPENIFISHQELATMLEKVRNGLKVTLATLNEAKERVG
jgi:hypothetical protein